MARYAFSLLALAAITLNCCIQVCSKSEAQRISLSITQAFKDTKSGSGPNQISKQHKGNGEGNHRQIYSTPALREIVVEGGPFDLQQRYLSMQGPLTHRTVGIRCLDNHRFVYLKATQISYFKNGQYVTADTDTRDQSRWAPGIAMAASGIKTAQAPPTLYWFTGCKAEVIDEKNRVMPGSEFMCHVNVNVDGYRGYSGARFPQATSSLNNKMCALTQGLTSVILPEGFGVPFSSEDNFDVLLQAANRTTNQHRRIKLRCHLYFIADQDTVRPTNALSWAICSIVVKPGQSTAGHGPKQDVCDDCNNISTAGKPANWDTLSAPLGNGQQIIGHWAIPPGVHRYQFPVLWPGFSSIGPIRTVWVHVHPFCQSFSLIEYLGIQRTALFTIHCRTITSPAGVQLSHIDCIKAPQGIRLNQKAKYAMVVTYNNTSGKEQDSMATMGIFFSDLKFKKPVWAIHS